MDRFERSWGGPQRGPPDSTAKQAGNRNWHAQRTRLYRDLSSALPYIHSNNSTAKTSISKQASKPDQASKLAETPSTNQTETHPFMSVETVCHPEAKPFSFIKPEKHRVLSIHPRKKVAPEAGMVPGANACGLATEHVCSVCSAGRWSF